MSVHPQPRCGAFPVNGEAGDHDNAPDLKRCQTHGPIPISDDLLSFHNHNCSRTCGASWRANGELPQCAIVRRGPQPTRSHVTSPPRPALIGGTVTKGVILEAERLPSTCRQPLTQVPSSCPHLRPQLCVCLAANHRSEVSGWKDQVGLVVARDQVDQGKARFGIDQNILRRDDV